MTKDDMDNFLEAAYSRLIDGWQNLKDVDSEIYQAVFDGATDGAMMCMAIYFDGNGMRHTRLHAVAVDERKETGERRRGERRQIVTDDVAFLFGAHTRRLPTRDRRAGSRMLDMQFGDQLPF